MDIAFEKRESTLFVYLKGEVDQHSAGMLRKKIDSKVAAAPNISTLLIDLSGVSFMDSSGIGVLLGRSNLMQKTGGELVITNAQRSVEKLLKLSGVYALLEQRRRNRRNG